MLVLTGLGFSAAAATPLDTAFERMMAAPTDQGVILAYAAEAIRAGDYEGAIGALERLLIFNPNLPEAELELGILYSRLGSYDAARAYLARVQGRAGAPEPVRRRAGEALAELDGRQSPHRFSGSVTAGLRYQSNANAGPAGGAVRIFGIDARLDPAYREEDDFNAFAAAGIRYVYDLGNSRGDTLEANLTLYGSRQFDATDLHVGLAEIDFGPRFVLGGGGTSVRPYLIANHVQLSDDPYFTTLGIGGALTVGWGDGFHSDVSIEGRHRDFKPSSRLVALDERDGWETTARANLRYAIDPDQVVRLDLEAGRNAADEDWESYRQLGAGASWVARFADPVGVFQLPWIAQLGGSYTWRDYDDPDAIVDPGRTRRDRTWLLGASLSVGILSNLDAVLQVQQSWVDSNLPNYKYDNFTALAGLTFRF